MPIFHRNFTQVFWLNADGSVREYATIPVDCEQVIIQDGTQRSVSKVSNYVLYRDDLDVLRLKIREYTPEKDIEGMMTNPLMNTGANTP
jgi:hypothetical protein